MLWLLIMIIAFIIAFALFWPMILVGLVVGLWPGLSTRIRIASFFLGSYMAYTFLGS